ncbi:MAG: PIG-L deacetylase family protein [Candidatus Izemoplasmatales bacterium]
MKNLTEIFVPDGTVQNVAIERTTHMAIAAHQDDIEIMAYHGIEACFQKQDQFFMGVVVTNGAGSARDHIYKEYTDEQMMDVRRLEQIKAAVLGEYSMLALLNYPSSAVKDPKNEEVIHEIASLLEKAKPEVVYTHNLADKHDTHIGVIIKTILAIRLLPQTLRPKKVYGCEVWRNLDWVNDDEKVMLDVSHHPNLASSLVEIFDSQIIGGKRYDAATIGRRLANATFNASHEVDQTSALTYAIDLTPLCLDDSIDILDFILSYIDRFKKDVESRVSKMLL